MEQEGIVCLGCNTMNEPGWSFCQQCGKRLTQPPASAPQPPAASGPVDLRTIQEQRSVIDPMIQRLRTNPEPQSVEHLLKTIVAQPPPSEPLSTVEDERPPVEHKVVPRHPLPAPPTVEDQSPAPPASERYDPAMRTVQSPPPPRPIAPTPPLPVQEKPVAPSPPPSIPKPSIPPRPSAPLSRAPEPTTTPGQSMSGVLCTQCGQSNGAGSAFCASCGAPMTFGKTMVISSQPAPPRHIIGNLHLVMEGGQPGEVYELEADTVIGRNNGEITFPHDGFMSGRHARIERRGNSFILTDEGSRNGTFVKIKGEVELKPGDMILVGKQLFRFEV